MNKQELLEKVESTISFVRSFLDEYRDEFIYENEGVLLVLLDDILHDISDGQIPMSLYERISRLLDTLNVENLRQVQQLNKERHNFTLYKEQSDNMIVNSVFVSKTYYLLKAIGFVNSNIVLIGANGSGKTTFANSIRDKLESTDNGIVIPAQKILIFPSYDFIPTYRSAYSAYQNRQKEILDDKQTFNASKSDDIPYELTKRYGSELRILVSALLGERMARRDEYCSSIQNGDVVDTNKFRSSLDDVIDIWNSLIEHRELYCDNSGNLQIKYSQGDETEEYPAFRMSDGEREIFYVVGRVLLAKPSSLIVIDEPELHLHKAILNKLWDILEVKRDDCMFVYLTHDIDFASSRVAQKLWLKSYTSGVLEDWELEPISDNDIPEVLLMKILGSRKKILFCEGKSGGIDHQIFECLFPNYTVIPVASCKDVINYTRAFNKISNKYADALGIIDRDFRTPEQLNKLETEQIFSYDVAEIENLFLVEDFIESFASYKNEECDLINIKDRILRIFADNIEQQTSFYVTQKINYIFNESHVRTGKTKEEVSTQFREFVDNIRIEDCYRERIEMLEKIISDKDYKNAILFYNNKGLHTVVEQSFGISSYSKKALNFLRKSDPAKDILRKQFPQGLY